MNWHAEHKEGLSLIERIESTIADFCGTRLFFILHVIWFAFWILKPFESFPYGLLTMIVSLEAILLSTIIMINQRRHDKLQEAQAANDKRIENDTLNLILKYVSPPRSKEEEHPN